jgi:hypothetical protein
MRLSARPWSRHRVCSAVKQTEVIPSRFKLGSHFAHSCDRYELVCACGADVPRAALESHREACAEAQRPVELRGLAGPQALSDHSRICRRSCGSTIIVYDHWRRGKKIECSCARL